MKAFQCTSLLAAGSSCSLHHSHFKAVTHTSRSSLTTTFITHRVQSLHTHTSTLQTHTSMLSHTSMLASHTLQANTHTSSRHQNQPAPRLRQLLLRPAQVERLKRSTGDAETALAARDVAVKELSVEGSRGEKARQAVEAEVKARDVRLQRALEEVERYKSLLSDARGQVGAGQRCGFVGVLWECWRNHCNEFKSWQSP